MPDEKPILFQGWKVRKILAMQSGDTMQTRRVIKPQPELVESKVYWPPRWSAPWATVWNNGTWHTWDSDGCGGENSVGKTVDAAKREAIIAAARQGFIHCPYGQPGTKLWVRETWRTRAAPRPGWVPGVRYEAGGDDTFPEFDDLDKLPHDWRNYDRKRPSIFMPRWASRITLEVTSVRVERVQDISEADAEAEGITEDQACEYWYDGPQYVHAFSDLWDSINAARGYPWESNPWVWVVTFKRKDHV